VAAAAPIIIVPAAAQPRLAFGKNGKALARTAITNISGTDLATSRYA